MKIEHMEDTSNHDIALDIYSSIMHHIVNNDLTHVNMYEILGHLQGIYNTDLTPIAVKIRNENQRIYQVEA